MKSSKNPLRANKSLIALSLGLLLLSTTYFLTSPSTATSCDPSIDNYENGGILFTVLTFSADQSGCQWEPPTGLTQVDALLVAGGGGGGSRIGGGGGGGEVLLIENQSVSSTSSYTVVVGEGGDGGGLDGINGKVGSNGGNSSLFGVTVAGGGGGGFFGPNAGVGQDGGSGGGGSCLGAATPGSADKLGSGAGNSGGFGPNAGSGGCVGGGGGGAGGTGFDGQSQAGGNGGLGIGHAIASTITTFYGGGGGGGINAPLSTGNPGAGGSGVGGAGGPKNSSRADGLAGTDGRGGGGGGGSNYHSSTFDSTTSARGGDGGDGVVIIRYVTPPTISETSGIVISIDPRSESVSIPYLSVTSGASSRICFDLVSNANSSLALKSFVNKNTDSDAFRMAVTFGDVSVEVGDGNNLNKITASRTNAQALLKRNVPNSESYLRLYRPSDGWTSVNGGRLKVGLDYDGSNCSAGAFPAINTEIPIKLLEIVLKQENQVNIS